LCAFDHQGRGRSDEGDAGFEGRVRGIAVDCVRSITKGGVEVTKVPKVTQGLNGVCARWVPLDDLGVESSARTG
jgi:hypothetical protein